MTPGLVPVTIGMNPDGATTMTAMSGIACVREQVPLAERTWFKLGGAAQFLAEPGSADELRKLAAAKLAREKPGQTLQATALVHDAYIRLSSPA